MGNPMLPDHNATGHQDAPLGSGIAVLLGLGAAYMVTKKRKED
jgi:LPXTG-motif cell wall-anchored protein